MNNSECTGTHRESRSGSSEINSFFCIVVFGSGSLFSVKSVNYIPLGSFQKPRGEKNGVSQKSGRVPKFLAGCMPVYNAIQTADFVLR